MVLLPIMDVTHPDYMFSKKASNSLQQKKGGVIILMSNVEISGVFKKSENKELVAEHVIKLTVNWKGLSADDKIKDAKKKKDMITTGSDFPPPWSPEFVTLVQFGTDITNADKELLARSKNEPNSARDLKQAVGLLNKDVKNIGAMIQLKMDSCVPDEAVRICLAAGYTYKAITVRGPRKNRVRQMTQPGWVQAEGEGEGGRNWQFSLAPFDKDAVIKDLPYTTGGVTTYNVGASRVDAWFRWKLVLTKGRDSDWSVWYKGETP